MLVGSVPLHLDPWLMLLQVQFPFQEIKLIR